MGISRIDFGGTTLIDLTNDSVTPETLDKGITAHNSAGDQIVGTREPTVIPVEKDVNFWDYDGTLLYSYTLDEAQALTELPPAPTPPRDFLEFYEWNWTLAQIKEVNVPLDVGAVYIPSDGCTRMVVNISSMLIADVELHFKTWYYGDLSIPAVVIDWGDGTRGQGTHTATGSKNWTAKHSYPSEGKYTITITHNSNNFDFGHGGSTTPFFGNGTIQHTLEELYIGDKCRCLNYCFYNNIRLTTLMFYKTTSFENGTNVFANCRSINPIVYPSSYTKIGSGNHGGNAAASVISLPYSMQSLEYRAIADCKNQRIMFPPNLTTITCGGNATIREVYITGTPTKTNNECFYQNFNLRKIVLPETITAIGNSAFLRCQCLIELEIPASVTSIGTNAFYEMSGLKRLSFKATTPPTVSNSNAFTSFPTTCIVEVPAASLDAYKTATNYGTIAAQMVGV